MTEDRARQARKAAERPELRIISRAGEELAADALSIADYQHWGCNDYSLVVVGGTDETTEGRSYVILSPKDLVIVKPRDKMDHVKWLVERRRYEEALEEVEKIEAEAVGGPGKEALDGLSVSEIGKKYMEHLVNEGMSIQVFCYSRGPTERYAFRRLSQSCEAHSESVCSRSEDLGGLDIRVCG